MLGSAFDHNFPRELRKVEGRKRGIVKKDFRTCFNFTLTCCYKIIKQTKNQDK